MSPLLPRLFLAAGMVGLAGACQAALIDRGGGMIYDTSRDITWLADMNHARTSGYADANQGGSGAQQVLSDGRMGWDAANAWASGLTYGGFSDWRLPTIVPDDTACSMSLDPGDGSPIKYYGYGCVGGELGGLFVTDLGNKPGESILDQAVDTAEQIANLALFVNVQSNLYWAGVEYEPGSLSAWSFYTTNGFLGWLPKGEAFFAMAVRDGDVGLQAVIEPTPLALLLFSLPALLASRRRR